MVPEPKYIGLFAGKGLYVTACHPTKSRIPLQNRCFPDHVHSCCELYMNLSGDVSFQVENREYPLTTGDLIITKPNESHHCIVHSDQFHDHYCLWLSADPEFAHLLAPFTDRAPGEGSRIHPDPFQRERLAELLALLCATKDDTEMGDIRHLSAVMQILEILDRNQSENDGTVRLPKNLTVLLHFIENHYTGECTVNRMCKVFFISRSTVNRLFRTWLNTTPTAYIESRRMALAKSMLEAGKPVQTVYEKSGFSDYSHFIALFKKRFGLTPFQYSKKYEITSLRSN